MSNHIGILGIKELYKGRELTNPSFLKSIHYAIIDCHLSYEKSLNVTSISPPSSNITSNIGKLYFFCY